MNRPKVRFPLILAWLPLVVVLGCQREADDDLRQSYERMIASAERRAAVQDTPMAPPALPVDTAPTAAAGTGTLPIDTLPASAPTIPTQPEPAAPAPFPGTAGVEQRERGGIAPATLRAVRSATHEEFDRIVFEFEGGMPGHHIEYVDRPIRECGSGRTVSVAGQGWLRVRLDPARAHEFVGETARTTVADRDRTLDMAVVRQLTLTCDFEAQVEWVLGMSSPNRYRVLELREPSRLVVDVLH
jgi:hypothetical protein